MKCDSDVVILRFPLDTIFSNKFSKSSVFAAFHVYNPDNIISLNTNRGQH